MIRSAMIALLVTLCACGTPAEAAPPAVATKADLLAAETAAWKAARPGFDTYCAHCHTAGGRAVTKKKLSHFDFTSYPPAGHHAQTIGITVRSVLGLSGSRARMPLDKPGSVAGDDLARIKAWTDAWEAADKAGAHAAR